MIKTRFGTFEELLAITDDETRPVVERLRTLIMDVHPEAVDVVMTRGSGRGL